MDTRVEALAASWSSAERKQFPVEFNGKATEYFGIWIVNVVLTVLTLGIYSAWAKVRRERYFRGNTAIDGHVFEYHAKPLSLLIGRLVVVAVLIIYNVLVNIVPPAGFAAFLLFFLFGLPWVVQRGLRFNARVSSYRNLRFDFVGGYWGAWKVFVLGTLMVVFSLGILAPVVSRWSTRYFIGNTRFAARPFAGQWRLRDFYKAWLLPFLVVLAGLGGLVGIAALVILTNPGLLSGLRALEKDVFRTIIAVGITGILYGLIAIYAVAGLLYAAAVRNVVFNGAVLDGRVGFISTVGRWRYVWIAVSNLVVTALTLGLMRPWAAVRSAGYLCDCTWVDANVDLDSYQDQILRESGLAASQFMELEGLDVGLGA